jgi:membrane associated rhomboid family serine protease
LKRSSFGLLSRLVSLPVLWVLGFWFIFQLLNSVLVTAEQESVAFFAHVSGFVAGMVLIPFFKYSRVPLFHPARYHRNR